MLPTISTPTYSEVLPSGLKVKFRPFLVKENKILLTLKDAELPELSTTIKELVDVCTFEKLDVDNMAHFDVAYLFLKIRSKSIGETVQARITCSCGEKIDTEYNIEDLKVRKGEGHSNKIMLDSDTGIVMKYPSLGVAIELINEPNKNIVPECIEYIVNGDELIRPEDVSKQELSDWIDNLSVEQYAMIENFFVQSPTIVQEIDVECGACGNEIHTEITSLYNFFF